MTEPRQSLCTVQSIVWAVHAWVPGDQFNLRGYAHGDEDIDSYIDAALDVFGLLGEAIHSNSVNDRLRGPVAHSPLRVT